MVPINMWIMDDASRKAQRQGKFSAAVEWGNFNAEFQNSIDYLPCSFCTALLKK